MTYSQLEAFLADPVRENTIPFLWEFRLKALHKGALSNFSDLKDKPAPESCHRWETRYFFPYGESTHIIVPAFESTMYNADQYRFKVHRDIYLLTESGRENVKIRFKKSSMELLQKSQLYDQDGIEGYAKKVLEDLSCEKSFDSITIEDVHLMLKQAQTIDSEVFRPIALHRMLKESMVVDLSSVSAKLELSKVYSQGKIYLSLNIESKSFYGLKFLKGMLNFDARPCSYMEFLEGHLT